MTLIKFLDELRTSGTAWVLVTSSFNGARMIRAKNSRRCPVSNMGYWETMGFQDKALIVSAADEWEGHDPLLREALLDACSLEEKTAELARIYNGWTSAQKERDDARAAWTRYKEAGLIDPAEHEELKAALADARAEIGRLKESQRPLSDYSKEELEALYAPDREEALHAEIERLKSTRPGLTRGQEPDLGCEHDGSESLAASYAALRADSGPAGRGGVRLMNVIEVNNAAIDAGDVKCPLEGHQAHGVAFKGEIVPYGIAPNVVYLTIHVPVFSCLWCDIEWTDDTAVVLKQEVVGAYLLGLRKPATAGQPGGEG